MNKFEYTLDNKRYHTYNYYLKNKFGKKVFKVSLNTGLSCPNRDGSKGVGGCTFCSATGSGDFGGNVADDLLMQFEKMKHVMHRKWSDAYYIGYFQAYTNTYADLETLKSFYEPIIAQEDVVGLDIATRCDAITDEVHNYLLELNERTDLWIELGLQSSKDETANLINRGHTYKEFCTTVKKLRESGIKVCVHIINGLPNETKEDMIETVKNLQSLGIDGLKIHMLHILKNTVISEQYKKEQFHILSRDEYVEIVCEQLQYLDPKVVIFRIAGDADEDELIVPKWVLKKVIVTNEIDKYMKSNNIIQGQKCV